MTPLRLLYSHLSDADLFSFVKQDDLRAFEELYNRYWINLVNVAYKRLQSKEKAEDIVQNIFADLYYRRQSINITVSVSAYLNKALKFKVLNEYRTQLVREKHQVNLFFSPTCKIDFAGELEAKELEQRLYAAVQRLPEKCRTAFLLSRAGDCSNQDISSNMQIALSTVEKHIGKALKILRAEV